MTINKQLQKGISTLGMTLAALALTGCASLPDFESVESIRLDTAFGLSAVPQVDVYGDPEARPGRMAAGAAIESAECHVMYLFCAAITVPLAAAAGATITAITTLPEEQAHELNRVTASIVSGLSIHADLERSLEEEAIRHGLTLRERNAEVRILVEPAVFDWVVSAGDKAAIRMELRLIVQHEGRRVERRATWRSEAEKVETWLANDAELLRRRIEEIPASASRSAWARLMEEST